MARSMANDPTQRFRFKVEIGSTEFGATTISGIEKEIEVTEYREGGYTLTHKLPGIASTGTLTIERGSFADIYMYRLVKDALENPEFRQDVTIVEQDRLGQAKRQWRLSECWGSKFTAPEYDASSSEVATETIEIQYEDIVAETL